MGGLRRHIHQVFRDFIYTFSNIFPTSENKIINAMVEKQLGVPIIWLDLPLEKLCAISTIPANV